tara:strand:+ start:11 stop:307 length:297 start_codon:yes stop_codon:yes gene_type:complete
MENSDKKTSFVALLDGKVKASISNREAVSVSKEMFRAGLSPAALSRFMSGKHKNASMVTIFKMCVSMGCTPNDLFNVDSWGDATSYEDLTSKDIQELW